MADEQEFYFDFQHLRQRLQHPQHLDLEVKTPTADQLEALPSNRDGFLGLIGLMLVAGMLFGIPYLISLGWHAGAR